jgi:hypothetical protein
MSEELQPGAALDALIAKKVLKWSGTDPDIFQPSVNDAHAMMVVDELIKIYGEDHARIELSYQGPDMGWCAMLNMQAGCWAATRAHAISLMALRVVEAMKEA